MDVTIVEGDDPFPITVLVTSPLGVPASFDGTPVARLRVGGSNIEFPVDSFATGTVTFTLPSDLVAGTYPLTVVDATVNIGYPSTRNPFTVFVMANTRAA